MVKERQIPPPWVPFLKAEDDNSWFERYPDSDGDVDILSSEY